MAQEDSSTTTRLLNARSRCTGKSLPQMARAPKKKSIPYCLDILDLGRQPMHVKGLAGKWERGATASRYDSRLPEYSVLHVARAASTWASKPMGHTFRRPHPLLLMGWFWRGGRPHPRLAACVFLRLLPWGRSRKASCFLGPESGLEPEPEPRAE